MTAISACGGPTTKSQRTAASAKEPTDTKAETMQSEELKATNFPKYLVKIVDPDGNEITKVSNEDYDSLSDEEIAKIEIENMKKDNMDIQVEFKDILDSSSDSNSEEDSFFFGKKAAFAYLSFGPRWCGSFCGNFWFGGFLNYYRIGYRFNFGFSFGGYGVYRYRRDCGPMCAPAPMLPPPQPVQPIAPPMPAMAPAPYAASPVPYAATPVAYTVPAGYPATTIYTTPSAYGYNTNPYMASPYSAAQPIAPAANGAVVNEPQGLCPAGAICSAGGVPTYLQ